MRVLTQSTILVACCLAAQAQSPGRDRANVVLIYIDNVGWGDLASYGNPAIRTPNMDRLAAQGVRLTDFYIPSSSCSPSRGALLTGRYPDRNGLTHQLSVQENWSGVGLPHSEKLLPEIMREHGYATAAFGKWNIGFAEGSRPTDRGFDEFIGCISGNCDYYTHVYNGRLDMHVGTEPTRIEGYSTDIFADAAADFIRRSADRPFFLFVPFNAAHCPNRKNKAAGEPFRWKAPAEFFEAYGYSPDTSVAEEGYRAVMTALDAGVGRVLQQLDASGLSERTLVVLASDNGGWVGSRKPELEVSSNAPFRSGRTSLYEGGVRTPCIIRWPGLLPANAVVREPLVNMDLFMLALRAAGIEAPDDRIIDGRDPLPVLRDGASSPHRNIYFRYRNIGGLRQGRWKLVRQSPADPLELYDLQTDFAESRDLAADQPALAQRLWKEFSDWLADARQGH
ncbi:MAG: sulfatase-like hydrolase/transferase [Acidobacteriia bacterium]|nr:sulfatase-like hydrolase/transferase [Terriglobia bacterium]